MHSKQKHRDKKKTKQVDKLTSTEMFPKGEHPRYAVMAFFTHYKFSHFHKQNKKKYIDKRSH